ncbi:retrovirus-related pol polyprotein from transposon TNT 1-94 [Tanacetum coccineum]
MSPNVGVDAVTCDDFFTKLAWERCSFSVFLPIFIQLSLKGLLSLSWNGLFATIKKVKFHDVSLVAYKSDELSLIVTKIGTLMMLDSYTSSMCLVTWDRSTYARILIEIDVCNGFSDNLVIAVPNLDRPGYTKETILVKYEWKPPHCSTCLIFGHSVDDCQKAQKLVVNKVDKDKCGSSGANDDGFIEVKKNKSGGNNRGTKNFKPISVKPKTIYRPKVNQPTDKKKVSTTSNSSKKTSKTNDSTSSNGIFFLLIRKRFRQQVTLQRRQVRRMIRHQAGQSSTLLVYKINMFKQQLLEGKCVLLDDEGKPLKKIDYTGDHDNKDKVEPVDNKMASILASKKIPNNIQSICDNLDIKVRGCKKK